MKFFTLALVIVLFSGCKSLSNHVEPDLMFVQENDISGDALVAQSYLLLSQEANRLNNHDQEFALLNELAEHQYAPAQLAISKKLISGHGAEYVDGTALEWAQKAVDNEYIPAILYLAKWYQHGGEGVEADLTKAMELYAKAIDLGDPSAATELGYIFLNHWRTDKGYETAQALLANAAYYGEAKALCGLGRVYQNASKLKNIVKAAEYFEVSYIRGYKACAFELGYLYHKVAIDFELAHHWYGKAASAGSADALNNLGMMHNNGEGAEIDFVKAQQYFKKASEFGSALSFGNLGRLYEQGKGVKQDIAQAIKYYERGVELGDAQSMHNLGSMFNEGSGVEKNRQRALALFEQATLRGNRFSAFNLGNAYLYGEGKEQSNERAIEYYLKSANQGYAAAFCQVADLELANDWPKAKSYYFEGAKLGAGICAEKLTNYMRIRNERDLPIVTLLISLANRGIALAYRELGIIYHYGGFGEEVNFLKAKENYLRAGELGEGMAYANLGYIYEEGKLVAQDLQIAASMYVKSVEQGSALGQNNLASFYSKGIVFEQDIPKAIELYELAANGGNVFAMVNLADIFWEKKSHALSQRACELYKKAYALNYDDVITKYSQCLTQLDRDPQAAYRLLEGGLQKGCDACVVKQAEIVLAGKLDDKTEQDAIQILQQASEQGNAEASVKLAQLYEAGGRIEQEYETALYWYHQAVKNGQVDALNKVAEFHWYGKGTSRDEQSAVQAISQLAEARNYNVASFVGEHYYYGVNIDEDISKARQYFLLAAKQNDDIALNNLGVIYRDGLRVKVDTARALDYFKRSAELGLADAMYNLGALNLQLDQTSIGLEWLLKAANQNYSQSFLLLGKYYASHSANSTSQIEAAKWLQLAADVRLPEGMYQLAMLLKKQNSNQLTPEAAKWLKEAALSGHEAAMMELEESASVFSYEN
ncbi:sel1 repeat family protein [Pseudoalteromonas luteoviolacea]|uniref:tetratricopeptide repeat protein n=1 Tax=Pseudoalteromonas luteoviolacea TaxID=43657 RepID=UPI001B37250F|nr:tetratricopeptide repeat protein [Pseudoalteromonas luteoviolacea]MBQ4810792.1 sel1 repeat family protein [Pseudoalteromonas luteoviolacea]